MNFCAKCSLPVHLSSEYTREDELEKENRYLKEKYSQDLKTHWHYGRSKEYENIARTIERDSASIVEEAISNKKEWIRREGRKIPDNFDDSVKDRFHALLIGFPKRIMRKYVQPRRAITEITVTNNDSSCSPLAKPCKCSYHNVLTFSKSGSI